MNWRKKLHLVPSLQGVVLETKRERQMKLEKTLYSTPSLLLLATLGVGIWSANLSSFYSVPPEPRQSAEQVPATTPSRTEKITAAEAKNHVGRNATVCGRVASTKYATRSKGQPTFINLDEPYTRHIFTSVIWGSDRSKFGQPETELKEKRICVTGKIEEHRGTPEMILRDRSQLRVEN